MRKFQSVCDILTAILIKIAFFIENKFEFVRNMGLFQFEPKNPIFLDF